MTPPWTPKDLAALATAQAMQAKGRKLEKQVRDRIRQRVWRDRERPLKIGRSGL